MCLFLTSLLLIQVVNIGIKNAALFFIYVSVMLSRLKSLEISRRSATIKGLELHAMLGKSRHGVQGNGTPDHTINSKMSLETHDWPQL